MHIYTYSKVYSAFILLIVQSILITSFLLTQITCIVLTLVSPPKYYFQCVCAVYRAHLLQSVKDETKKKHPTISFKEYDLFVDQSSASSKQTHRDHFNEETRIPTLDAITSFYRNIFLKSQMETGKYTLETKSFVIVYMRLATI